jgi:hypothetical protein
MRHNPNEGGNHVIIKDRFESRRWLHASQARRTAVTAPLSGRVRRARCRCASRTPVGNEGGSAVLSTCMRRSQCRCAIRHTSSNCGRTAAYAIRRNRTQSYAIRRNHAHLDQLRPDGVRGFRAWELCAWPVVVAAHLWGRGGGAVVSTRASARPTSQSCALPATIKRQSRGNQEAIKRQSIGNQ